ncbi:hypothetical protein PP935_gp186 [Rhizobium phage RHph_N34]|uniref:Uncharacterized protein n=1 Tax=Rhizobium phage RHph_N34 TaxID=2509586 RepID=A0A7S5RA67_9CAUD|nr:hypothetical protein PP935_gp186 [Rhizobium phage RHph_N34]QIG73961.1 hypothetical protein EVC06_186 [Rhizobium phage RHph_N34]
MELNIPKEVLVATRDLVEKGWHKGGNLARNIDGHGIDWLERRATSFTMQGAFYRAAHKRKVNVGMFICIQEIITQAIHVVTGRPMYLFDFDDREDTTQESTLKMLDEAIRISERGFDVYEPGLEAMQSMLAA